jgi:cytochrome c-type biogenesis protein CcmH/NrfF
MYPELKLNSVVLWQCPVFAIYLVQTLMKLQDNVTEVSVHPPRPSEYLDSMLMTDFILIWCRIIYAVETA